MGAVKALAPARRMRVLRTCVDAAMALLMIRLMAVPASLDDVHEALGVTALALIAVHLVLNRKPLMRMFRGRHGAQRVLLLVLASVLCACTLLMLASSLIISRTAFGCLPAIPGSWWARPMHLAVSGWMFILVFVHAGIHVPLRAFRSEERWVRITARVACVVAIIIGAACFVQLGLADILFMRTQFTFVDPEASRALAFAQYAAVAAGAAAMGALLQRSRRDGGV